MGLSAFPGARSEMKAEVSLPVAGLTYQVAENWRGFSVLCRLLEEGSANSYGKAKETCLAVYPKKENKNLGKRSGWSRSVSEAVCVLANDGLWRR